MENLNQYLESKIHELWTDNESRHDAFWPLAMTSIVGVGTLRQNPQLASIFRSKKGGSAIDNKQLWPIWMTEACDKEAANMQAIFTSSQTWTLSNSVKSIKSANSECKQIIVRCYLHLWRYHFTLVLQQTRRGLCQMSTTHLLLFIISSMLSSRQLLLFCTL